MKTVLYIKANPKSNELSRTFRISEAFIESYIRKNPQDKIIVLDLYKEKINFLTGAEVAGHAAGQAAETPMLSYARQFAAADKYVIAAPLWNLGMPAILKAYIDYIAVSGIAFKYTAEGPQGLLKDKKAVYITARGGFYDKPPMSEFENASRYAKAIFGFLGIYDLSFINADGLDVQIAEAQSIVAAASEKAVRAAETF